MSGATDESRLEAEIDAALEAMKPETRALLAAWCAEHGIDERTAVVRLAAGELDRRLWAVFGDLLEKPN